MVKKQKKTTKTKKRTQTKKREKLREYAKKEGLTEKQKRFCEYYIQNPNATEAALKAGYAPKTAYATGAENLKKPQIKEYIDKVLETLQTKRIADAKEVLEYLTGVMRGEIKDQFDMDVSIQDRNKAAELLGKSYRLFVDKQEVDGKVEGVTIVNDIPRKEEEEEEAEDAG